MPVPEKTEGPVSRDANKLRQRKHGRSCCWVSMRCPCLKRPKGRLAGTQTNCGTANTAGPFVEEACDARARKERRAGLQGRKRLAWPQTPQGQLSGKHAMPVPEKPVCRDANELRHRTHRRACCRLSMRYPCPKRP